MPNEEGKRGRVPAPHERLDTLAHTTWMRAEDGAALPCYRLQLHGAIQARGSWEVAETTNHKQQTTMKT